MRDLLARVRAWELATRPVHPQARVALARRWVEGRVKRSPRFRAIDEAVASGGFRLVLLLRLSPLVPFNLLNYMLGLTRVSTRDYILGSVIGMAPMDGVTDATFRHTVAMQGKPDA